MKALIFEGKVVDIQEKEFEVHPSMTWVDATEDTEFHGTWDGSKFGPADTRTDEQKTKDAWAELRSFRDTRLATTDWMALSDVTMSDAWKKYRQDLRDLPDNTSDPTKPTWPTKPD
tara:strand:+ start:678 stop:1025 length:348 start_codon:yes stop_codon:yes gene_type:complete